MAESADSLKAGSGLLELVVEREMLKDGLSTNSLFSGMKQFEWVLGLWLHCP